MGARRAWIAVIVLVVVLGLLPAGVGAARWLEPLGWWPEEFRYRSMIAGEEYVYLERGSGVLEVLCLTRDGLDWIGLLPLESWRWDPLDHDGHALIVQEEYPSSLKILDLSDPSAPLERFRSDSFQAKAAVAWWPHLYLLGSEDGGSEDQIRVMNWVDRWAPWEVGRITLFGSGYAMARAGDQLVVVDDAGLRVLDVTDPSTPSFMGSAALSSWVGEVQVSGEAVVASSYRSLEIISVADPWNPRVCESRSSGDWRIALQDRVLVAVTVGEIEVYELAPDTCELLPIAETTFEPSFDIQGWDVRFVGDRLVVVGDGTLVVDLSDPSQPCVIERRNGEDRGEGLVTWGPYLARSIQHSIRIYDVSNPAHPVAVSSISSSKTPTLYSEDLLFCQDGNRLSILDVSNPAHPMKAGDIYLQYGYGSLEISRGFVFSEIFDEGFQIFDVRDPMEPTLVESISCPGDHLSFSIAGEVLYLGCRGKPTTPGELRIFDIREPSRPERILPDLLLEKYSGRLITDGGKLYSIGSSSAVESWVEVISLSDPEHPESLGIATLPEFDHLALGHGLLTLWEAYSVLRAYDADALPEIEDRGTSSFTLHQLRELNISDRGPIWVDMSGTLLALQASSLSPTILGGFVDTGDGLLVSAWTPHLGIDRLELIWDGIATGTCLNPQGNGWYGLLVDRPQDLPPGRHRLSLRGGGTLPLGRSWPQLRVDP